jgi:MoaA/NifB/PqqE/SkfB family radical SAM enzyme
MKRSTSLKLKLREARFITRALMRTDHPVLAHVIPMRRCNLACSYCNEYDKVSDPVPLDVMKRRLDALANLGTSVITISGGEPLMHPDLDEIISYIRSRGVVAGLISNGYYMTPERIRRLNEAGLEHLQISIDNVNPDEVSRKSLKNLDKKLQNLAAHADFHVNINSVIGGGIKNPDDALTIARRAQELGFSTTVGIIHDGHGLLKPLSEQERKVYDELKRVNKSDYARLGWFQDNLAAGKPNNWRCRSGGRYLYICEEGLVHYCSQQRGTPGVPIEQYTKADVEREYNTEKWCAPLCTVACAHKVAILDNWRNPQKGEAATESAPPQRLRDAIIRTLRAG